MTRNEADPIRQTARERAIHAAALALVACEWGISPGEAMQGWENFSEQQRAKYLEMARIALKAAEAAMHALGHEWSA